MINIYLKEKIGNPDLFTGRKREMRYLLNWVERIKPEFSKSTALLSRRKTGKTAIFQRLYNLVFEQNNGVVPFYYELKEGKKWAIPFSQDFYLTFVYQYIAFKSRDARFVALSRQPDKSFAQARTAAQAMGDDYLVDRIERMQALIQSRQVDFAWDTAREMPWTLAADQNERVVQMIDEFQFLNSEIYWDEAKTNHANDFAAGYMSTAEYRNAPLLISGSWVGWLMHDLQTMLPGRFKRYFLDPLPTDEAVEMVYRYSLLEEIPVSEETAYLIATLTEGSPFYISSLMRSEYDDKDLTTEDGVLKTLEYETLSPRGDIRSTWLEYIDAAFPRINERHAKDMVLYLSKHRDRAMSYQKLKRELQIDLPEHEIRKKLKALLRNDMIEEDNFLYRGVQDNIFDKVFRGQYGAEIDQFVTQEAPEEYKALYESLKQQYNSLSGEYNRYKGMYAEFMITQHLLQAQQQPAYYRALFENLAAEFEFAAYQRVWSYHSPPLHEPGFQIDIFAHVAKEVAGLALIGEVKHRQAKFTVDEAQAFERKVAELRRIEQVTGYQLFVFCSGGFQAQAIDYFRAQGIVWSEDLRWLEQPAS